MKYTSFLSRVTLGLAFLSYIWRYTNGKTRPAQRSQRVLKISPNLYLQFSTLNGDVLLGMRKSKGENKSFCLIMSVAHAYNILQQIFGTEVTEAGHKLAMGTAKAVGHSRSKMVCGVQKKLYNILCCKVRQCKKTNNIFTICKELVSLCEHSRTLGVKFKNHL